MIRFFYVLCAVLGCGTLVYSLSNVTVDLSSLSVDLAKGMSSDSHLLPFLPEDNRDYDVEISKLNTAMAYFSLLILDRKQIAIPQGEPRELEDWYKIKSGICYDVSRSAEEFLTYIGFQVRHVSVYTMKYNSNPYSVAVTSRNPSHAVSEVLTRRGWILFDAHFGSLYVDAKGNPISTAGMYKAIRGGDVSASDAHVIFSEQYMLVYGLYSRHGMLYPPFVPVPDIAWADFLKYGCCEVVR